MRTRFIPICGALVLALGSACASRQPTPELVEARAAYQRAQNGPAVQANPAGLYEAKRALDAAERKQDDDPGSDEAKNLAYIADRKVLLAEANARLALAQAEEQNGRNTLAQMQASELSQARGQLSQQSQMMAGERKAREEADQRAKDALDKLSSIASIKQDQRGFVLTLTGSVLFATNKSELMPAARQRLTEVAKALKQVEGRHIVVDGFTDSTGSDERNMKLSQERADAVKTFLVSRGVKEDMITAEGRGKQDPVASNATPDGRANNRRVEIVIEKIGTGGSDSMQQQPMQQQQQQMPK
jgi:outer membrane protein OmpA-like peptidoglycan-associated protein